MKGWIVKMRKKIIISILAVLIIAISILIIAYKVIEKSVTNRENFNFTIENISSSPVNTINHEQNNTCLLYTSRCV